MPYSKGNFPPKTRVQLKDLAAMARGGELVESAEERYRLRVEAAADEILAERSSFVLVTGPSASGKTTSSLKLAAELQRRGEPAVVISMDDFFKPTEEYPRLPDGTPDFEHVDALDLPLFREAVMALHQNGEFPMPKFDFSVGRPKPQRELLTVPRGTIVLAEGIHALDPLVFEGLPERETFRIYAGLREEYYRGSDRVISTRDLRITRRFIRDSLFRNYNIEKTLLIWDNIVEGENRFIKPFKKYANWLLDTSFTSEVPLFSGRLRSLVNDPAEGGSMRDALTSLASRYSIVASIPERRLPEDSMLREFLGGLSLSAGESGSKIYNRS